jgi:nitrite reductase (NO-forming)
VVRVALVDAVVGFDVTPDQLLVDGGTHPVLDVVNDGDEVHDLALEGGARTDRLDPGQSQRLDLGVITSSPAELYCTLPDHKSAG